MSVKTKTKIKLKCFAAVWLYFIVIICSGIPKAGVKTEVNPRQAVRENFELEISDKLSVSQIFLYNNSCAALSRIAPYLKSTSKSFDDTVAEVRSGIIYTKNVGTAILSDGENSAVLTVFQQEAPERKQYKIVVYKGSQTVVLYTCNSRGEYSVPVRCMPCSTGTAGENETVAGDYKVRAHYRWRLLYGPCYGQYGTSISGNYLFHSMPYKTQNPNTVYDYELLGQKASHGCIRLSAVDAKWIFDNCGLGSSVSVTEESCEKAVVTAKINPDKRYSGWDPTDPDPGNPYYADGLVYAPVTAAYSNRITLLPGETVKIDIKSSAPKLIYTSDNDEVAAVTADGVVTAKRKGRCTVYIMATDGSYCRAAVSVE